MIEYIPCKGLRSVLIVNVVTILLRYLNAKKQKIKQFSFHHVLLSTLIDYYNAGQTQKSITAFANLKKICEEHLKDNYTIEIIDLKENPQLAKTDQILVLPTLVKKLPKPVKKIIGDLSKTVRVLVGLDIVEV